jgi:hypothetical protein
VKAINRTNFLTKLAFGNWAGSPITDYLLLVIFLQKVFEMILYLIQALILAAIPCAFVLIAAALLIAALPVQ